MESKTVYTVNLGRYVILNVPIELTLEIELSSKGANIKIPLPDNYPPTKIGISRMVKSSGLIDAGISIVTPKNSSWGSFQGLPTHQFGITNNLIVFLHGFYNNPKTHNIPMIPEETLILNGLGKRILCISFPYIIQYFNIEPNNTLIMLQASGGDVITEADHLRVQQYLVLGKNNIINIYQNKYPADFNEQYANLVKYTDLELANALVSLENNEKLIQYYTYAFGFQPLTYISMHTAMGTLISIFLYYCNK